MTLSRRRFQRLALGAVAFPILPRFAWAQAYPSRPVRVVVGFAAGSGIDILARLMGQWLTERLGQPFVIENRPGAGTNIATEAVVRSAPDGHTLLAITPANAINATLYDNLNFDFIRDIAPVASLARTPCVMLVNRSVPAKSVPEFIAYAKANSGRLSMASGGGMVHVPYRGAGPALTDLIGGQVQVMFPTMTAAIEHIRAGRLRALAVTTAARSEALPDIPAAGEFVPGYEAVVTDGVGVAKSTPPELIDILNKAINAGLADPSIKARLASLGVTAFPGSPTDFGKHIADETDKWAKVIRFAGIKPS
jgi:tripartite-type tricarboxylate transporter receptor subunit TctC